MVSLAKRPRLSLLFLRSLCPPQLSAGGAREPSLRAPAIPRPCCAQQPAQQSAPVAGTCGSCHHAFCACALDAIRSPPRETVGRGIGNERAGDTTPYGDDDGRGPAYVWSAIVDRVLTENVLPMHGSSTLQRRKVRKARVSLRQQSAERLEKSRMTSAQLVAEGKG